MALTLEKEQRLDNAGLVAFFSQDAAGWQDAAQQTYDFIRENFPEGSRIRPDDVSKALVPILEVHENFQDKLADEKLRQKFWNVWFAELIIDRTWAAITQP